MKIVEIGTGYTCIPAQIGAATEIVVEELTRSLLHKGYNVTIMDIKDKNRVATNLPITEVYMPQFFSSTDTSLGIVHKLKRVIYSISLTYKIHQFIKNNPYQDIFLHFHNQYNLFFFFKLTSKAYRERVKIGYTVHSHIWFGNWEKVKDTIKKRYFQEVYCCQHADKVFVLNNIVASMLKKHCNITSNKIIPVINGVNTNTYTGYDSESKELDIIRQKYNLYNKSVILQIGSICKRKNQLGTIQLLSPIIQKDKSILFMYAGGVIDKHYKEKIDNYTRRKNIEENVFYMGEVSPGKALNRLYTIAQCTIMNSQSEAFALVIAEALSARRPIFINENIFQSLPFLQSNEGNGIIRIKETFKDDLYRLLSDKKYYRDMQNKGRQLIENAYSWDASVNIYSQHFK